MDVDSSSAWLVVFCGKATRDLWRDDLAGVVVVGGIEYLDGAVVHHHPVCGGVDSYGVAIAVVVGHHGGHDDSSDHGFAHCEIRAASGTEQAQSNGV